MRILQTQRLHLRPVDEGDKTLYCRVFMDAELMRQIGRPLTQESAEGSFHKVLEVAADSPNKALLWIMSKRNTAEAAGLAAVLDYQGMPEIGAMVFKEYQGEGFAFEALSRVRDICFENHGFQALFGRQLPSNRRSIGLMEKLGFQQSEKDDGLIHWYLDREGWQRLSTRDEYVLELESMGGS